MRQESPWSASVISALAAFGAFCVVTLFAIPWVPSGPLRHLPAYPMAERLREW
jgi:hypothetical protein